MAEPPPPQVDFDVHGLAGLRLLDAGPGDLAAVVAQLGPSCGSLDREPDITIRYVERIETSSGLRYLGAGELAFTDDAFFVLRGRHKARVRVQLPVADLGRRCEIVCERGVGRVPLLIAVINLTVLANGGVALHASAFEHEGRGVLVTGWSKGGKTEALLAFLARGARYIGDEWVYIDAASGRLGGLREPVRVWDWHLDELPELRRRASLGARGRLAALRVAARADLSRAPAGPRVGHAIRSHRFVDLPPERLGGAPSAPGTTTRLDRLFLVTSTESAATVAAPVAPEEVAERMVASLVFERAPLFAAYAAYRYSFPQSRNRLLERADGCELDRLRHAFAGVPACSVEHPYPVPLRRLGEAMAGCMDDAR